MLIGSAKLTKMRSAKSSYFENDELVGTMYIYIYIYIFFFSFAIACGWGQLPPPLIVSEKTPLPNMSFEYNLFYRTPKKKKTLKSHWKSLRLKSSLWSIKKYIPLWKQKGSKLSLIFLGVFGKEKASRSHSKSLRLKKARPKWIAPYLGKKKQADPIQKAFG